MSWFLIALKKYATFDGRARRKEYWFFVLFYILFAIAATFIDVLTGSFDPMSGLGMLGTLLALGLFIPSIAVSVRRLHDTDRSGWWFLINFVPLIGAIWFLVLMIFDSTPGDNRFGPNPKELE
jgi:uncharacterized membrane protein YhaH (DUF805 family)